MFRVRTLPIPSLAIMFAGSMDCLTTIVGISYFGASEANPAIANIANTNISAFTIIKLAAIITVGLLFLGANKVMQGTVDKTAKSFKWTQTTLKVAEVALTALLVTAVVNNVLVIAHLI
jgi:hypothetical protein